MRTVWPLVGFAAVAFAASCLAMACLVMGCVRDGAPVVAPVEVSVEGVDGGLPRLHVVAAAVMTGDRCTMRLRAGSITTQPNCILDERISQGSGTLNYPCTGNGPAFAVFGEHRFVGRRTGRNLDLALETGLDLDDGCHWETKQRLAGELVSDDAARRSKLAWTYAEMPTSGPNGNVEACYDSCSATADVEAGTTARGSDSAP